MTVRPWRSGFCNTYPHADWQTAACERVGAGHSRNPTKDDARDWVDCVCPCHQPAPPEPRPVDEVPTLQVAVELARLVAEKVTAAAKGAIAGLTWDEAIDLLDELRTATGKLADVDAALTAHIYHHGPHGDTEVDGIGVVKIYRSQDRKNWDHLSLAQAVLDAHMDDRGGEYPDPAEVVRWITDAAGFSYWRLGVIRDQLGLPVDEYVDTELGGIHVTLPKRR